MKIGIIGTGYVGMVTAVGLAELGHNVTGTDIVLEKIDKANQGIAHIYEPGLEVLLKKHLKAGTLTFSHDLDGTIRSSDVLFVSVNTPQQEDGSADMSFVESVSRRIAENLNSYKLIVEKSTVPVKTSSWIKRIICLYQKQAHAFDVASNPEFLREGSAVKDFLEPDRIIIGVETDKARDILTKIYKKFHDRILITNIDTAELIKHASNSFLAMKISFINLISDLCEKTDADVELVAEGMGLDSRIGKQFLNAGIGYGGSCFPKDVRALAHTAKENGFDAQLLNAVENVNNHQKTRLFSMLSDQFDGELAGKCIAIWGLAFKPNTDDMREAPSRVLIDALLAVGASVRVHDPEAMGEAALIYGDIEGYSAHDDQYAAAEGADALVLVTEWKHYWIPDFECLAGSMRDKVLVDGRNIWPQTAAVRHGFRYHAIGRPSV